MRWFYIYKGRAAPSGGHKQIRLMVSVLNEIGGDGFLLYDGETNDDHLYAVAPPVAPFTLASAQDKLAADDVLIFPEVGLERYLTLTSEWPCRKAVNNQNGFYALQHRPRSGYGARGIEFALANAEYVAALTHRCLGLAPERIFRVPHWVYRPPFAEEAPRLGDRPLRICYMPRKLPDHIAEVRRLTEANARDFEWMALDNIPEREVAAALRSCRVFLSTQDQEGCPLPALESMSCGAVVAGYAGTSYFPHPYANDTNGYWAADRSPRDAATQLQRAIADVRRPGAAIDRILASGRETARAFGKEPVAQALREVLDVVGRQSYADRRTPEMRLGMRGAFAAATVIGRALVAR